ncbi:MAG: tetratricopeptide repeat protein [Spirochaetota bacterium]
MANKKSRQEIKIDRNPIEAFLMQIRDYIRKNKRQVYISVFSVLFVTIATVAIFVYMEAHSEKSYARYELIIENYRQNPLDEDVKNKTINDLKELIDETSFGFIPKASNYILGNIYFEDKKFEDSYKHLNYYVDKTSVKDTLHPIALNKAAVALEELGEIEKALFYLVKHEEKNKDSIVMDQVLYNIGRLYNTTGDRLRAREYFNKLIDIYPDSGYANRARERLFLMSFNQN